MFLESSIIHQSNHCHLVRAVCRDGVRAEELRSSYIGPVRQISMFADLYCEGRDLVLEAMERETLLKIIDVLNHSIDSF